MADGRLLEELLPVFSDRLQRKIERILLRNDLTEIRLRANLPLLIRTLDQEYFVTEEGRLVRSYDSPCLVQPEDIQMMFQKISQYSLFAYKEEIGEGFITIRGGHRIGLCGRMYRDGEKRRQIRQISSMNFRIARQVIGCSQPFFPYLTEDGCFLNTLLISPPGAGKTTFLRDIIRILSDGTGYAPGRNVAVVDERSEIGNRTRAAEGFYLGKRTDLLDHCQKAEGMLLLLRSMGPEVIAADEIGDSRDVEALRYVRNCGCGLLMTVHGKDREDVLCRPVIGSYLRQHPFDRYVEIQVGPSGRRHVTVLDARGRRIWRGAS
ncbi:MAG: stage III sporulation protein AA [Eubacteriales bacterium]|nr:stage III sporulation protein AA [Eubacteriales bacterium]